MIGSYMRFLLFTILVFPSKIIRKNFSFLPVGPTVYVTLKRDFDLPKRNFEETVSRVE